MLDDELKARIATANWAFGALPDDVFRDAQYLDVGFGSGNALIAAALKGAALATGIDIDFQQRSQAVSAPPFAAFWPMIADTGISPSRFHLVDGDIVAHDFDGERFDVISMLDVIEHLDRPAAAIRRCAELLKPDGILLIAGGGLYHSHQGHHLWHWFPPDTAPWIHLWSEWTDETKEDIRRKAGVADWHWDEFQRLNRVTVSTIRQACADAGLREDTFLPIREGADRIHAYAHKIDIKRVPSLDDLFLAGLVLVCRK